MPTRNPALLAATILFGLTPVLVSGMSFEPQAKPDVPPIKKGPQGVIYPLPTRDVVPLVAAIDTAWKRGVKDANLTPASEADDAEYLRRVTLDLTGRVPSVRQAKTFLDSRDPDKRRKLVDELLSSSE